MGKEIYKDTRAVQRRVHKGNRSPRAGRESSDVEQKKSTRLKELRKMIGEIYKREKIKWRQQAHNKWLKEGDANTFFFHKVVNMRRRVNTIHTLTSTEGTLVGGADIYHICHHFNDLFGRAMANKIEMIHEQWHPIVDLHVLERDFSEEEVKKDSLGPRAC